MKLTDKQKRFCEEYMKDLNGTQAAIRAGYAKKTAPTIASENLIKPNIQKYIQQLQKDIRERNNIEVDEVVQFLANVIRFDPSTMYDETCNLKSIHDIKAESRTCIESIDIDERKTSDDVIVRTKRVRLLNKLSAADKLMRHLGGYNENKEGSQSVYVLPMDPFANEPKADNSTS